MLDGGDDFPAGVEGGVGALFFEAAEERGKASRGNAAEGDEAPGNLQGKGSVFAGRRRELTAEFNATEDDSFEPSDVFGQASGLPGSVTEREHERRQGRVFTSFERLPGELEQVKDEAFACFREAGELVEDVIEGGPIDCVAGGFVAGCEEFGGGDVFDAVGQRGWGLGVVGFDAGGFGVGVAGLAEVALGGLGGGPKEDGEVNRSLLLMALFAEHREPPARRRWYSIWRLAGKMQSMGFLILDF